MRRTGSCRPSCQVWASLPPPGPGLTTATPDLAANMIGRSNARRGARRIFAVLQNRRLNQHIVYTIIDEARVLSIPLFDGLLKRLFSFSQRCSLRPNRVSFPTPFAGLEFGRATGAVVKHQRPVPLLPLLL